LGSLLGTKVVVVVEVVEMEVVVMVVEGVEGVEANSNLRCIVGNSSADRKQDTQQA
jgi:hypothetical protein